MSGDSIFQSRWNDIDEQEAGYSRLCICALVAAFFGPAAFLVYFTPWFFFLGVIAMILGLIALWSIARAEGLLTGTLLAYFGISTAAIALVSIAVFWGAYQHGLCREADHFFRLWFAAVQKGDIPQAKGYVSLYSHRSNAADAETWWKEQYGDKRTHRAIHQYVEDKLIRTLMALGEKAQVSYYKTLDITSSREDDIVSMVYAVTFPAEANPQQKETFFVRIDARRMFPPTPTDFKAAGWRLEGMPAFYLPDEFKEGKTEKKDSHNHDNHEHGNP